MPPKRPAVPRELAKAANKKRSRKQIESVDEDSNLFFNSDDDVPAKHISESEDEAEETAEEKRIRLGAAQRFRRFQQSK